MDRDVDAVSGSRDFNWRRLWVVVLLSAAIVAVASLLVRNFPNPGYQAGYDLTIDKGETWIRPRIDSSGGTAAPLCNALYEESDSSPTEPRYEYDSFVRGCEDAVNHLYGRHVPHLAPAD